MEFEIDYFHKNLELWSQFCPEDAEQVRELECLTVSFSKNKGTQELNLKKVSDTQEFYLYSQTDIKAEMHQWLVSLPLHKGDFFFVYGIGLGYYFQGLKSWLAENPSCFAIFLEDDLEVIHRFLETPYATTFLETSQVRLYYLNGDEKDNKLLAHLGILAAQTTVQIFSLLAYQQYKGSKYQLLHAKLSYECNYKSKTVGEYFNYSLGFLRNFYENVMALPESRPATALYGKFLGIPAIICGAGPSLEKNREVLKTLKDRALIIAGGTAINALNADHLIPHFGVGVDPNPFHFTRIISNQSYEMPFFYRSRMNHEAFEVVHGDRLYLTGAGGHVIPDWFEKKLGIQSYHLAEGHNVVNMCVSLAHLLGCNPIIIVGVDLAYSQNKSYAPGILHHAIHERKTEFFTKSIDEELLSKKDIHGEYVYTLWKWVDESLWYGFFHVAHPELTIINCTEGGIGFPRVENVPLAAAAEQYLVEQLDLDARINGEIKKAKLPPQVTKEEIYALFEILRESVRRCATLYQNQISNWKEHYQKLVAKEDFPEGYVPENVNESQQEIEKEEAYEALLKIYNQTYIKTYREKYEELYIHPAFNSKREIELKKIDFTIKILDYLRKGAEINAGLIQDLIRTYKQDDELEALQGASKETVLLKESLEEKRKKAAAVEKYAYEKGILTLIDPEFNLHIEEPLTLELKQTHYANGKTESECFHLQGQLYGPSSYYDEEGNLLSRAWFYKGLRQGKARYYYPSGSLASLQRFQEGKWDGLQEYYYENGNLKSLIPYKQGRLHGEVLLYFENGSLHRKLQFKEEMREGIDILWDKTGAQIIEAHYADDKPIKTARVWYPNGNIAREVIYEPDTNQITIRKWTRKGKPLSPETLKKDDYFDSVTKQTSLLTDSIEKVYEDMAKIVPLVKETQPQPGESTTEEDFSKLKSALVHLRQLNDKILESTGINAPDGQEAIWKSPSARRGMEKQINEMTQKMQDDLKTIQEALGLAIGLLAKNPEFIQPPPEPPKEGSDNAK